MYYICYICHVICVTPNSHGVTVTCDVILTLNVKINVKVKVKEK